MREFHQLGVADLVLFERQSIFLLGDLQSDL